jgi:hypothetical protein
MATFPDVLTLLGAGFAASNRRGCRPRCAPQPARRPSHGVLRRAPACQPCGSRASTVRARISVT